MLAPCPAEISEYQLKFNPTPRHPRKRDGPTLSRPLGEVLGNFKSNPRSISVINTDELFSFGNHTSRVFNNVSLQRYCVSSILQHCVKKRSINSDSTNNVCVLELVVSVPTSCDCLYREKNSKISSFDHPLLTNSSVACSSILFVSSEAICRLVSSTSRLIHCCFS